MGIFGKLFKPSANGPRPPAVPNLAEGEIVISGQCLQVHFKQAAGPSRPGLGFIVHIGGNSVTTIFVRAYTTSPMPADAEKTALGAKALAEVRRRWTTGWRPGPGEMLDVE